MTTIRAFFIVVLLIFSSPFKVSAAETNCNSSFGKEASKISPKTNLTGVERIVESSATDLNEAANINKALDDSNKTPFDLKAYEAAQQAYTFSQNLLEKFLGLEKKISQIMRDSGGVYRAEYADRALRMSALKDNIRLGNEELATTALSSLWHPFESAYHKQNLAAEKIDILNKELQSSREKSAAEKKKIEELIKTQKLILKNNFKEMLKLFPEYSDTRAFFAEILPQSRRDKMIKKGSPEWQVLIKQAYGVGADSPDVDPKTLTADEKYIETANNVYWNSSLAFLTQTRENVDLKYSGVPPDIDKINHDMQSNLESYNKLLTETLGGEWSFLILSFISRPVQVIAVRAIQLLPKSIQEPISLLFGISVDRFLLRAHFQKIQEIKNLVDAAGNDKAKLEDALIRLFHYNELAPRDETLKFAAGLLGYEDMWNKLLKTALDLSSIDPIKPKVTDGGYLFWKKYHQPKDGTYINQNYKKLYDLMVAAQKNSKTISPYYTPPKVYLMVTATLATGVVVYYYVPQAHLWVNQVVTTLSSWTHNTVPFLPGIERLLGKAYQWSLH
jgi:hypothetical protein